MCGKPFDLEATPNFARLIDDADLPWPPASPIEWPLKNWQTDYYGILVACQATTCQILSRFKKVPVLK